MAINTSFPTSPYEILDPDYRWFSAMEWKRYANTKNISVNSRSLAVKSAAIIVNKKIHAVNV